MNTDFASSLEKHFGFTCFRPGQEKAIQSLLENKHTLVVMPTGSGKSLIYQLVALLLPGITLVISPLIALMKDQVDSLKRRGIPATFINSTLTSSEQTRRLKDLEIGNYRIVYIAPERLRSAKFRNALQHQKVSLVAVDEAHCISEWGHDFRPDYLHIAEFRAALSNPLTAALTATATPKVQDDIARLLNLSPVQCVITGFNRPNLALEVRYMSEPARKLQALQDLLKNQGDGAAIIYTGTRRDSEEVAEFVNTVIGTKTQNYHAGLLPEERTRIQNEFMTGKLSVVAATNAFGMGIDRQDVRQVIHYSLPGSLEAYYQEAGRAGRDNLPARAVLLYSPDDRALQEWFIENSNLSIEDLRLLYDALRPASDKQELITIDTLSYLTGLQEVKVRVGIAELEHAGVLEHLSDEGTWLQIILKEWKAKDIQTAIENHKQHQANRKAQLERMIVYAESNTCRRRIILKHFGDTGPSEAKICCDNCEGCQEAQNVANDMDSHTLAERAALVILDTARRSKRNVGHEKLAQILKGSKAKDILQFHYDKNIYYGRLAVFSLTEIKKMIGQLLEMRYFKVIGGEYPVLLLTPQGESAIHNKTAIPLKLPHQVNKQKIESKKAERQAGGTLEYTAQLFSENLNVEEIAARRGLSPITIYSHATKLIMAGKVRLDAVVCNDTRLKVEEAIRQVGSVETLYPIKILLPDEIDYNVIHCVVEGWKRGQILTTDPKHAEHPQPEDPISAFLSRPHPRPLPGPWETGWALGFHSRFSGADWSRSGTGDLAYRLKYQGDLSALPALVEQAMALIKEHPELAQVDAIIAVPPSNQRPNDPVSSFTKTLAQRFGLAYWPVLIKSRQTAPQKELRTLAQKRRNVAGAFGLKLSIKGKRLLVVDDLYDSGATLEEIFHLLRRAGATKVCVLSMTRTIHSDA